MALDREGGGMTLEIHVHGKPVVLTDETLSATWKWHADLERRCAAAAASGEMRVNDLDGYVKDCEARAVAYEAREGRMSLAFIQQAYFIQSGESVPLLSGGAA